MDFLERGSAEMMGIFYRFKNRNFEGSEGQAIKNSTFLLLTTIIAKVGSLLFTLIIARLLMPELFGLYSLALGTIVLFAGFSDFGISSAMVTFVAKSLGKDDPEKAKAYFKKLIKAKYLVVLLATFVLLGAAYFVANSYYNKPIFYALLAGGLYLPISSILGFIDGIFRAVNKFNFILIKEVLYQFLRLSLVPLAIFFLLKTNIEEGFLLAIIIFILSICLGVSLAILVFFSKRKISFLNSKMKKLTIFEKKNLIKFTIPITFIVLSSAFFGYIDTIMLGRFVTGEFLGYYAAAFSLVASISAIISFSSGALFPIFARLKGKKLETGFRKTRLITFAISLMAAIITFFLAKYLILIAYGKDYLTSIFLLKLFAVFVLMGPIIGLYESYFISQEKTKTIAILLIITTIINIVLNIVFISYGLKFGMYEAILGAAIATLISRGIYLFGLGVWKKFKNKFP